MRVATKLPLPTFATSGQKRNLRRATLLAASDIEADFRRSDFDAYSQLFCLFVLERFLTISAIFCCYHKEARFIGLSTLMAV